MISPIIMSVGINLLIKTPIFSDYGGYISGGADLGIGFLIDIIPINSPIFVFKNK